MPSIEIKNVYNGHSQRWSLIMHKILEHVGYEKIQLK